MDSEFKLPKKPFRALGRGLSALMSTPVPVTPNAPTPSTPIAVNAAPTPMPEVGADTPSINAPREGTKFLSIDAISPNSHQPRQIFSQTELTELAQSIKALGVIQPILVRPGAESGKYELIAGERRWRAARLAGLNEIPAIVQPLSGKESLQIAIVENVQRENLNPLEEARAYQRLVDEFGFTQKDVADAVGKERASVANYLRLLKLPQEVLEYLQNGSLTMGHAKAILSIREPSAQVSLAKKTVKEGLSVRALEAIVSRVVVLDAGRVSGQAQALGIRSGTHTTSPESFPSVTDRLRNALGTKVIIKHHPSGKGKLEIDYFSEQELDRIVEKICG